MNAESKVGILVLSFVVTIAFFAFKIGGNRFPWQEEEGYLVHVIYETTTGLQTKALVRYAGVEVGKVETIDLYEGRAKVTIKLQNEVQVRANSMFQIASLGLMGEKYVSIYGGTQHSKWLADGDQIDGHAPVSMDQLVNSLNAIGTDIKGITAGVKDAMGTESNENRLLNIVENIEKLSEILATTADRSDDDITETMRNFREISGDLKEILRYNRNNVNTTMENMELITTELAANLPAILRDLTVAMRDIRQILDANSTEINETLENVASASVDLNQSMENLNLVTDKIGSGEGSIGKLIYDDEFHENLNKTLIDIDEAAKEVRSFMGTVSDYRLFLGYRAEYLSELEETKGYISLKIQPSPDKYYLLELVFSKSGEYFETEYEIVYEDDENQTQTRDFTVRGWDRSQLLYNLQFAKTFHWFTVRAGMIESTGGFGVDMNVFTDKFRLSFDGWDFSRDSNPHFKIGARYEVSDSFYFTGGWDDFLLTGDDADNYYFGAGIMFEDRDLKYLMSFIPMVSGS